MTNQTHKVSTDALDTLGTFPIPNDSGRDAIHLAVEPVIAGERLVSGDKITLVDGKAFRTEAGKHLGIVDPFITGVVQPGEKFWLIVLPRQITSLRHVWSHPLFPEEKIEEKVLENKKAESEKWMRNWAMEHMSADYDNWDNDSGLSEEQAYANAIRAGEENYVGPYEDARDHIDSTWWDHWETITGKRGDRDEYFSCSC